MSVTVHITNMRETVARRTVLVQSQRHPTREPIRGSRKITIRLKGAMLAS